jgi:hypothetical protein
MFEQTFKNIDDILHKDAGCSSELDNSEPELNEPIRPSLQLKRRLLMLSSKNSLSLS